MGESTQIRKSCRFLVFYNGTKEVEDRSEFRLSSAYENPTENPDLELRVTMLNVNDGHSSDLMEHCRTLKEYAQYVARVRKYAAKQDVSLEEGEKNGPLIRTGSLPFKMCLPRIPWPMTRVL